MGTKGLLHVFGERHRGATKARIENITKGHVSTRVSFHQSSGDPIGNALCFSSENNGTNFTRDRAIDVNLIVPVASANAHSVERQASNSHGSYFLFRHIYLSAQTSRNA